MAIRFDAMLACSVCGGQLETESDGEVKGSGHTIGIFKVLPCVYCSQADLRRQAILEELAVMAQSKMESK